MSLTLKGTKPHPENWVPSERQRVEHGSVAEIVDFKMLKHSGLLVKVRFQNHAGGMVSTWLHSKDFKVHTLYYGGTAALHKVWA